MRKIILLALILLLLSGCNYNTAIAPGVDSEPLGDLLTDWVILTNEDELFRLTVYIERLEYAPDEEIKMHSTLEYIGEETSIDTWGGDPHFIYTIHKGEIAYCSGFWNDVAILTTFKKNEAITYPFHKSGFWNADDPKAVYWESFYKDPELRLPAGEYVFCAFVKFSFDDRRLSETYKQAVEFKVIVE